MKTPVGQRSHIVERDALGRITHLTETVSGTSHDVSYSYDLAGRLKTETRDGTTTTYTYDLNGNRTSVQVGSAAAVTATYDAQDRILTRGTVTYVHTAHGDLSTVTDGTNSTALTYDELGNLTRVIIKNGTTTTTVEYVIDGLGRRVARKLNGAFDRAWLYRDSLLSETAAGFQPFGFAGGLYDATTKLVRFGARDYDAAMGRWTNKDPIGFAGQQGNVYLYVNGDPVNRRDRTGLVDVFYGWEVDAIADDKGE